MTSYYYDEVIRPSLEELENDPGPEYNDQTRPTSSPINWDELQGDLTEFSDDVGEYPDLIYTDENEANTYRDAAELNGLDVYAFYKSFRFLDSRPFPGRWGIFLLTRGVAALAAQLAGKELTHRPSIEFSKLATDLLIKHEEYHFWIDVWALQQEMLPTSDRKKRYERYLFEKAKPLYFHDDIEESLANHHAFMSLGSRRLSSGKTARKAIVEVLSHSPGPYARFNFEKSVRQNHESLLAVAVKNGKAVPEARTEYLRGNGRVPNIILSESLRPPRSDNAIVGTRNCPRHFVWSGSYSSLLRPFLAPSRDEAQTFVRNYLDGVAERFTDHQFYKIDNGETIKFPNGHKRDLKVHEFKNILFKAGMNSVEYRRERENTRGWTKNCPRSPARPPREN